MVLVIWTWCIAYGIDSDRWNASTVREWCERWMSLSTIKVKQNLIIWWTVYKFARNNVGSWVVIEIRSDFIWLLKMSTCIFRFIYLKYELSGWSQWCAKEYSTIESFFFIMRQCVILSKNALDLVSYGKLIILLSHCWHRTYDLVSSNGMYLLLRLLNYLASIKRNSRLIPFHYSIIKKVINGRCQHWHHH